RESALGPPLARRARVPHDERGVAETARRVRVVRRYRATPGPDRDPVDPLVISAKVVNPSARYSSDGSHPSASSPVTVQDLRAEGAELEPTVGTDVQRGRRAPAPQAEATEGSRRCWSPGCVRCAQRQRSLASTCLSNRAGQ